MIKKILDKVLLILFALLIVGFMFVVSYFGNKYISTSTVAHTHEYYTEILDKYITYTKDGRPRYWLVYKFTDGCVREFSVSSSKYYRSEVDK